MFRLAETGQSQQQHHCAQCPPGPDGDLVLCHHMPAPGKQGFNDHTTITASQLNSPHTVIMYLSTVHFVTIHYLHV